MSEIKVNKISPRSGTEVTLGDSGDTFTIPSGATINNQGTATNFGATGSASWTTTVKTSGFTAVAGEGYFVDTSSGAISVNLPAGTAGAVVAFKDYLNSFDTHNLTLVQNGSDKIGGSTVNATVSTEGIAITLIFIDSTQGWLVTDDGLQSNVDTNAFIVATGGTITTSGNDKIHTFTGPGTFCVSKTACAAANNLVSYVVVAGGGGGGGGYTGSFGAGGGGAGGFREVESPSTPYTASPLDGYPSSPNRITVTATSFPITVGAGGAGKSCSPGNAPGGVGGKGGCSVFSTITSAGGGGGSMGCTSPSPVIPQKNGGSGGGMAGACGPNASGNKDYAGVGNTPPVSPSQGNPGGSNGDPAGPDRESTGGGGATAAGADAPAPSRGGNGGAGATTEITASPVAYAGGGGGGAHCYPAGGTGGTGGGGNGGAPGNSGTAGTTNRGSGGGGGGKVVSDNGGGNGGSGIVIIRYKIQ